MNSNAEFHLHIIKILSHFQSWKGIYDIGSSVAEDRKLIIINRVVQAQLSAAQINPANY